MRTWFRSVRFFFSTQALLRERAALLDRPWEEHLLHWAKDGTMHGTLVPPVDGRVRSVASDGWCPCWARQDAARHAHPGSLTEA